MRCRRKKSVAQAEQWFPDRHVEGVINLNTEGLQLGYALSTCDKETGKTSLHVDLRPGDWVITYPDGSREKMSDEELHQAFEVDDE